MEVCDIGKIYNLFTSIFLDKKHSLRIIYFKQVISLDLLILLELLFSFPLTVSSYESNILSLQLCFEMFKFRQSPKLIALLSLSFFKDEWLHISDPTYASCLNVLIQITS